MNMTYFEDYLYLMANKICHRRIRSHCENLLMWEWKANPQNYTEYRWRISFDEMFCSCQLRWSSSEGFFCITDICPVIWFSALSETLCFPSLAKKNKSSHEAPPELEKKIQNLVINAQKFVHQWPVPPIENTKLLHGDSSNAVTISETDWFAANTSRSSVAWNLYIHYSITAVSHNQASTSNCWIFLKFNVGFDDDL